MTEARDHLSEEELQAVLDDVLAPELVPEIEDHLGSCRICGHRLEQLEKLSSQLEALPELAQARDLSSLVISRLREEHTFSPGLVWTLILEALGAGLMIGILVPTLEAAAWPLLTRLNLPAALQVFAAQLASSWLVWWAGLKLQFAQLIRELFFTGGTTMLPFSPWILVAAAGGLGVLINTLLLGAQSIPGGNGEE